MKVGGQENEIIKSMLGPKYITKYIKSTEIKILKFEFDIFRMGKKVLLKYTYISIEVIIKKVRNIT